MVALIIINIANIALATFAVYHHERDFAIYLLGIFMLNTLLYFTFYIAMKLLHKERVNIQATIFLIISLSCAASAMYFFLRKSISWAVSKTIVRFNHVTGIFKVFLNVGRPLLLSIVFCLWIYQLSVHCTCF